MDDLAVELRRQLGILTPAEVAAVLAKDERTLTNWRSQRTRPPYSKVGKHVLYREAALVKWIEANEQETQPSRATTEAECNASTLSNSCAR